jgi:serine/threonine protein kinase
MNVPEGEMLTEKQLQQRAPEIHGLFAGIVKGHIELLKHNVFQNDYNLGNYYVDENKRACIGDLDSCYIFGGQNERINLPTAWTSYNDSIDFFKNPSVEKAKQMVVFATGCQLYDALKGKLPFALEEGDFAIDDSRRYPIIPQELLADCDPFIAKMMSLDPSQRPSLEEVYDYLAIHSGEVIPGELDKLFAAS